MARRYLTQKQIILIHRELIDRYGGLHGIRDQSLLESAIGRYRCGYYADAVEEAAALMESLIQNHPFIDGNKRIAVNAAFTFLIFNGHEILTDEKRAFDFIFGLFQTGEFSFAKIEPWLRENMAIPETILNIDEDAKQARNAMRACLQAINEIVLARQEFNNSFHNRKEEMDAIQAQVSQFAKTRPSEKQLGAWFQRQAAFFKRFTLDVNQLSQRIASESRRFLESWAVAIQWSEQQLASIDNEETLNEWLRSFQQNIIETNRFKSEMYSLPNDIKSFSSIGSSLPSADRLTKKSLKSAYNEIISACNELEIAGDKCINSYIELDESLNVALHSSERLIALINIKLQNQTL